MSVLFGFFFQNLTTSYWLDLAVCCIYLKENGVPYPLRTIHVAGLEKLLVNVRVERDLKSALFFN